MSEQVVRKYLDAKRELSEAIDRSQPQTVTGPAKIVYLGWIESVRGIEIVQLHPGQVFEGKCIVYDVGIYD